MVSAGLVIGDVTFARTIMVHTTLNRRTSVEMPTPSHSQFKASTGGSSANLLPGMAALPGRRQIAPASNTEMMTMTTMEMVITPQVSATTGAAFLPAAWR
jgi:hypothetical protein